LGHGLTLLRLLFYESQPFVENQIYMKESDGWRLLGILCIADALDQVRSHERLGRLHGIKNMDASKMTGRIVMDVIFLHQARHGPVQVGPRLEVFNDLILRQSALEKYEDHVHGITSTIHDVGG